MVPHGVRDTYEEFCLLGYNAVQSVENQLHVSEERVASIFKVE
jgi:hypothetical protein